jgi:hypothetical protein
MNTYFDEIFLLFMIVYWLFYKPEAQVISMVYRKDKYGIVISYLSVVGMKTLRDCWILINYNKYGNGKRIDAPLKEIDYEYPTLLMFVALVRIFVFNLIFKNSMGNGHQDILHQCIVVLFGLVTIYYHAIRGYIFTNALSTVRIILGLVLSALFFHENKIGKSKLIIFEKSIYLQSTLESLLLLLSL